MKLFKTDEEILLEEVKEKDKKQPSGKGKVIFLGFLAFVLMLITVTAIYLSFFSFKDLRNLGYKNSEIFIIAKNGLASKVKEYNQCFLYSIKSDNFKAKNADYYLLFSGEFDYTDYINSLAQRYSLDEVKELQQFLNNEEIMEISVYDKASNISNVKKCKDKGYSLTDCIKIVNSLNDDSINTLLTFDLLSDVSIYKKYLDLGYSDVAINKIYDTFGDENFNTLVNMKYFSTIEDILSNKNFKKENFVRYLMYIDAKSVTTTEAIEQVNNDKDATALDKINFSSYYVEEPTIVTEVNETTLINKSNKLSDDYQPSELVEVDPLYRANNQPLQKVVAEQFVEMSKACKDALSITVVAYNGYFTYEEVEKNYNDLINSGGKITKNSVDSVYPKAGYSENQTGLAVDVASKYSTISKFSESQSYDWIVENCHKYGFIQRYPLGKEFITGYAFQAYHLRYVGVDVATLLYENNWTLEEYDFLCN